MADMVKCPVCGESNAADQEFCQYCQSRLQALTGPLKGADAPLHPGQIPTKKVTAELEPILPQWLRDARNKARQSAEEDASQVVQRQEQTPPGKPSEPDLLAGLRSQSRGDDEEDTPDWLANITGAAPKSKKAGSESYGERRVELGDKNDFARDTAPLEESTPSWLASMQAASQDSEKDELKDWFRESSGLTPKQDPVPSSDSASRLNQEPAATSADALDGLRKMSVEDDAGSTPAWLDSDAQSDAHRADSSPIAAADLGAFDAGTPSADEWLRGLPSDKPDPPLKKHTTPLWLKGTEYSGAPAEDADTPVWLDDSPTPSSAPPLESPPSSEEQATFGDIPNWLKAAAPQSSIFADSPVEETPLVPPEASGWLSTFKSEVAPPSAFSMDQTGESAPPAAFTPDAFQDGSADALFTEMPDWLSKASELPPAASSSALSSSESIIPGELPSWVQAMRPVDTSGSRSTPLSNDQTLETRGALSGLQGVLPAVPGYGPSSKPKAFSIRMQATQEQQSHAALLEQILAAEGAPVPISSFSPLVTSRPLRWLLSVAVLALLFGVISLRTQIFSMPAVSEREKNSFNGALTVANSVPVDAPVLVAMDYHPARAGEMEAAAAPMFDQMDILRHSHWIFISTNETGPILAERFITGHTDNLGPLNKPDYQYGIDYLNLGYLPGGVMGIRAFTQDPTHTMKFDTFLNPAWSSTLLQGIESLSQFGALIVITDNADSARAWIEQTTPLRAANPFPVVVITSAQAAPMIYPYFDSGQVSGIVNGLNGGAVFEQNNAGRPGTARSYWDAYSLGMLLAMSAILGGGLWSSALGLRDRAAARAGR